MSDEDERNELLESDKNRKREERKDLKEKTDRQRRSNNDRDAYVKFYSQATDFQCCAVCGHEDSIKIMTKISFTIQEYFVQCGLQRHYRSIIEESVKRNHLYLKCKKN